MKFKPSIKPYTGPAGGWGSLEATTRFVLDSKQTLKNMRNLMRVNKGSRLRLPRLRLGRRQPQHLQLLRKRRQSGQLGSDAQRRGA